MLSRRVFLAGSAGVAAAAQVSAWGGGRALAAAVSPPALADFFRSPLIGDAALSPKGRRIAVLGQTAVGPSLAPEAFIDFHDADDIGKPPRRVPLTDLEAETIDWASEDRLLVWVVASKRPRMPAPGSRIPREGEDVVYRRVLAMDPDGANPVILFENRARSRAATLNLTEIVDALPDEPDHVLMTAWDPDFEVAALYKVNVRDGRADVLERGDAATVSWKCQAGAPVLRYDMDREGRIMSLLARSPGESKWRLVRRIHRDETKDFQIVGATPSPGVVLVAARAEGEDAAAVRTLDTRTMALGPVLSARRSRDVSNVLTSDRDQFVAAAYYEDRLTYDFVDPKMARHYKALNRFFDDECNIQLFDMNEDQTRWLARVTGPREPGTYVFYDTRAKRTQSLGQLRPWLKSESLATVEPLEVKTRDGAMIRAYVTKPVLGRGPRPLVVLPHGGPEIRDHQGYDPWAQALAAQGWLVLQPNFRGSGGYGRAFAEAGWKRWADRMQEDIEDAVDLLVKQRRADPQRIAIFGASYGGYAALMGAIRRPDQYKAVVAAAAPADLPEMLRFEKKRQKGDPTVYEFWKARMGDPVADARALERASPRQRAAEIKPPVLLIHGVRDDVVPVAQTRAMATALKAAGKTVAVHEMKGVGHADWGLHIEKTAIARVIDFLASALA